MTQKQFAINNYDAIKLMTQYEGGQKLASMYFDETGKFMKDPQRLIRKLVADGIFKRFKTEQGETLQA